MVFTSVTAWTNAVTRGPKRASSSSAVTGVSSSTSWRTAASTTASEQPYWARIPATATGWVTKGAGDPFRYWLPWA